MQRLMGVNSGPISKTKRLLNGHEDSAIPRAGDNKSETCLILICRLQTHAEAKKKKAFCKRGCEWQTT
jgi:hypothetical protein